MQKFYLLGKISAQPHTTLCIQFLDRKNNDKNNALPLGKQICFTGREIAPNTGANATKFFYFGDQMLKISRQIGD